MKIHFLFPFFLLCIGFISCKQETENKSKLPDSDSIKTVKKIIDSKNKAGIDTIIADCNYTFEQAIEGTKAPQSIIDQLTLINVKYYSTDGKIHSGQILTNNEIADELSDIFDYIYQIHFPVSKVIPIVKYNWSDEISMQNNNTYSFCYRNVSYSKHAKGLAIDINPYFNPERWKPDTKNRADLPLGAKYNPTVPGTFTDSSSVVREFKKFGFRWGRNFKHKSDDHHFEK